MSNLPINSNYILDGLYTCRITIDKISKGLYPCCTSYPIIEEDKPVYFAEYVNEYIDKEYDYTPTIFPIYHAVTNNDELKSFWLSQYSHYSILPNDFNCVSVYLDDIEKSHMTRINGNNIYTILTDEIICQKERLKEMYNDAIINVKFIIKSDNADPFAPYHFEINDTIECVPKYLSELFKLNNEVLQYYKNVKKYNHNLNYIRNEKKKLDITVIFTETNYTPKLIYETMIIP